MQLLSLLCCSAKGVGVIIKYNSLPKLKSSLACLLVVLQTWVTELQAGCCPNCRCNGCVWVSSCHPDLGVLSCILKRVIIAITT